MDLPPKRMTARDDFAFFHPLRVRWNECDMQGIVFNANYFLYYDIAVFEWTRALGYALKDAPEFLTVRAEAEFAGSAFFDDELEIGCRASRLGTKSLIIDAAIFRGDAMLNEGRLSYVYVMKGTRQTAPLDPLFVERVLAFERRAPERKSVS